MDKYEYNIKIEQIAKLIKQKDYITAAKIADGIDWARVKNVNMLSNIGNVYEKIGRYDDAKEIFLLALERTPMGRRFAYKLTEVCIASGDYDEAERYLKKFVTIAPKDTGKYELHYKLAKKKGASIEEQIAILEEYKKCDFDACWAYELAKMYHKAGLSQKCVSECDELILWYGEGEYVEKAMELKMLYGPLSPSQQEKYNKRFGDTSKLQKREDYNKSYENVEIPQIKTNSEPKQKEKFENQNNENIEVEKDEKEPEKAVDIEEELYNTTNLQELAHSVEMLMDEEEKLEGKEEELQKQKGIIQGEIPPKHRREILPKYQKEALVKHQEEVPPEHRKEILPKYQKEKQAEPLKESLEHSEAIGMETENLKEAIEQVVSEVMQEIHIEEQNETKPESPHLNEEQKQIFSKFLEMKGIEEQLCSVFQEVEGLEKERETSQTGNIIVTGEHKTGKTTLAMDLMRQINRLQERKGRKIAKISGERLNHKDMKETINRLIGADLLIERAGEMAERTVRGLLKAMTEKTGGMIVVLEDTPEDIQRLIQENPQISEQFSHYILLEECNTTEWVEAAKAYAQEQGYQIDDMATLALSAKIAAIRSIKKQIEIGDIIDIINVAIYKSEKKNIKRIFGSMFKKANSSNGVLKEVDFE